MKRTKRLSKGETLSPCLPIIDLGHKSSLAFELGLELKPSAVLVLWPQTQNPTTPPALLGLQLLTADLGLVSLCHHTSQCFTVKLTAVEMGEGEGRQREG